MLSYIEMTELNELIGSQALMCINGGENESYFGLEYELNGMNYRIPIWINRSQEPYNLEIIAEAAISLADRVCPHALFESTNREFMKYSPESTVFMED